ncbi:MAG: LacI family DNA-binding transcriptional regulator [Victivallales bacterium]|nr:LacI family DNA-binding transcriptional regulator [Victivallales bacterium]
MINSIQMIELKEAIKDCPRNDLLDLIHSKILSWIQSIPPNKADARFPAVSVLAGNLGVARQTAQKVYDRLEQEKVIFRLPNERIWRLRKFKQNSLKCIALLLPMTFSEYYQLSVEYGQRHFDIYCGMTDRAMELGAVLTPVPLLHIDASEEEIDEWLEFLKSDFVGVIHLGNRLIYPDIPLRRLCECADIPQIAIDWEHDMPWGGTVSVDAKAIARTVLTHLREHGHKNICLTPFYPMNETEGKYTYSMRIFHEFVEEDYEFFTFCRINANHRMFNDLFENELDRVLNKPSPPTAFWCIDDTTAMEVINYLNARGKQVPRDFSVIGFDNLPESQTFNPPVTTIQAPRYEMGYIAISKLFECIENQLEPELKMTYVPCTLYARQSVGPCSSSIDRKIMAFNSLKR